MELFVPKTEENIPGEEAYPVCNASTPPVHGAAMMGKYIHDSKLINESFDCHYINLTTAKNLEDIGHFRLGKIVEFAKL